MFRNMSLLLITLMVSVSLAYHTGERIYGNRLLKKASKPVEWDDLGFSWGKRSQQPIEKLSLQGSEVPIEKLSLQRFVRSWKADKKAEANWEDLGFAWGR